MAVSISILLTALLSGDPAPTITPKAAKPKVYVVYVTVVEVDVDGNETVLFTPRVQTTGKPAGVIVDRDDGRSFEFNCKLVGAEGHKLQTTRIAGKQRNSPVSKSGNAPNPLSDEELADAFGHVCYGVAPTDGLNPDERSAARFQAKQVSVHVKQKPRRFIISEIASQGDVNLYYDLDPKVYDLQGDSTLIDFDVDKVSVREAVDRLLSHVQIKYLYEDEVVKIVPDDVPAQKADDFTIRTYDVSDLLKPSDKLTAAEFEPLIQTLKAVAAPDSWADKATIRPFTSTKSLVIKQREAGHQAVAAALNELRPRKIDGPETKEP